MEPFVCSINQIHQMLANEPAQTTVDVQCFVVCKFLTDESHDNEPVTIVMPY